MKVLILAGGRGKRLNSISENANKCMVPVNDVPIIEYSLRCIADTEITEIIIVVGYRAEDIINTYGNSYHRKTIKYVIQPEQKGLVHAIECAAETISDEDFMLMLGDELMIKPMHHQMIEYFNNDTDIFAICGTVIVEDINLIKKTYSVIQSDENRIFRLVEKPSNPLNNIMGTGNCIFRNEILSFIPHTPINQRRNERELPDLIQCAVDEGRLVKSFRVCDHYVNLNEPKEIEKAESYFTHL